MEEYCGENTLMKCLSKYNCLGVTVLPLKERTHRRIGKARVTPAASAKSLQSCPTVRPHRRQPTRLPRPWDSPGKNTGVGCHFLLQCVKVKSGSEVAQLHPTLSGPMDCSLPGFSAHGSFQARVLECGAIAFSEEWPLQRWIRMVASLESHERQCMNLYMWLYMCSWESLYVSVYTHWCVCSSARGPTDIVKEHSSSVASLCRLFMSCKQWNRGPEYGGMPRTTYPCSGEIG